MNLLSVKGSPCILAPFFTGESACARAADVWKAWQTAKPASVRLLSQLKSAHIFMDMDTFHEWVFVTPGSQVDDLVQFLETQLRSFRCLPPAKVTALERVSCTLPGLPGTASSICRCMRRTGESDYICACAMSY